MNNKVYWKGVEELNAEPSFIEQRDKEFQTEIPVDEILGNKSESDESTSRRDFLKYLGFGVAAASIAACEAPVRKSIPYLVKPEEIIPGVPNWYASTYFDGNDYCSIVVKTREGRPIKIEGNELSPITKGGVNARVQASVLDLYDGNRLQGPVSKDGKSIEWNALDAELQKKLSEINNSGKQIALMTSSLCSPSVDKAISLFKSAYSNTNHVVYDAVSYYGIRKAHLDTFGAAMVPSYAFDKADVIVSIDADFLANWVSPIEHAAQYAATRKLNDGQKNISRHYQIESALSLSGSNADHRYPVKPSEMGSIVVSLYNKVAALNGGQTVQSVSSRIDKALSQIAQDVSKAKGKAIVVCGSNDPSIQSMVNGINQLLGSYGNTIFTSNPTKFRNSDDAAVEKLLSDLNAGNIGAIIFYNVNPVYTLPGFEQALSKAPLKVSLSSKHCETSSLCDYTCPDSHYLESWNDHEAYNGSYSLCQPTINPLYNTRQAPHSLLVWAGQGDMDYMGFVKQNWTEQIYAKQNTISSADAFWNDCLEKGVYSNASASSELNFSGNIDDAAAKCANMKSNGLEVVLYEKTGIGNGQHANNPWLQELPDPISKICWDNYISVSPAFATEQNWKQGDIIELSAGQKSIKAPVFIQPGQASGTVSIALGYGRSKAGKTADQLGANAYTLTSFTNGALQYFIGAVNASNTGETYALASTQTHHTLMGRNMVKETNLDAYLKDPKSGNPAMLLATHEGKKTPEELDLWATEKHPGHPKPNHFWNMSIDLNACIGCGACVIACQAENNVPVVGKQEVMTSREMHWIRIDRYYSSEMTKEKAKVEGIGKIDMYEAMEIPESENPSVVFQPMLCQHCNHAPCETVCPVAATTHSAEGLNMMAYNRCVGTRYCANNCPYKVRRFNWFKYSENAEFDFNMNDPMGRMVLNPDVVVRSRGVMEKCTMCVQRIQYGKLEAKKSSRMVKDGEIQTACSQSCPTKAITFGDANDSNSAVAKAKEDPRHYFVLEELNVQPSIFYQTKVRNRNGLES
ncbi:MAG TPA: TAT-variant-translocated molybdopterin oxidoreductase [Bacteroidia bacterium]|nr:TAT-variant-translocated molybdopterin oxidoreductase [Bacteroidia bacterium]HNT79317.1 TAT-variant-translocated molybdopterin oxidoreductase [Bacteroidia bacterium]